ncbi:uncharacterized protein LOC132723377 [Ruditapes philippinarum]|uniref:uncharacterized protein LOC132723377 n=1 Tax=Ruditapes philippinarum TaxID=129788 RepID=UPI00295ABD77|nr:uncharacterized protein LOC132723377 [Ruditapes philippinarum]
MVFSSRKLFCNAGLPEMRLPSISESSSGSQTSSTSPRSLKTSRTREDENPFRRNSRRISISSSTSSLSSSNDSSSTLKPPALSPKQRRTSFDQSRRSNSIDLTTSEEIMKKLQKRRQSSVLNIMPDGRKASFGSIGARVTTILKAKNAFALLAKKRHNVKDDTEEHDKEYEIEELPKEPRFASTLSAEAQYAMMKGYEDVVYSNLCRHYPEYRPMLRRNQTPHTGIIVKSMRQKFGDKYVFDATKTSEGIVKVNGSVDSKAVDSVDSRDTDGPVSASTPKSDDILSPRQTMNTSSDPELKENNESQRTTKKVSSFPKGARNSMVDGMKTAEEEKDTKKKLVMTYRYQRAMDILDSLREHQGVHALSPRKRDDRRIEPLKDYNSWSHVWTREFEPKRSMEIA